MFSGRTRFTCVADPLVVQPLHWHRSVARRCHPRSSPRFPLLRVMSPSLLQLLTGFGRFTIGQVLVTPSKEAGIELRHTDDAPRSAAELESFSDPLAARQIAHYNAAGEYRPLKGAPRSANRLAARIGWPRSPPDRARDLHFCRPRPLDGSAEEPVAGHSLVRNLGPANRHVPLRPDDFPWEGAASLTQRRCREGCSRKPLWADGIDSGPRRSWSRPCSAPRHAAFS